MSDLSASEAREFLSYEKTTGVLVWLKKPSIGVAAGSVAGCVTSQGYLQIRLKGSPYLAHRLAFLIVEGRWPDEIDHVNGNRKDNSWANIRECTRVQNMRNKRKRKDSHGITGVTWHKSSGLWRVHIGGGGMKSSSYYESLLDAVAGRLRLEKELGYSARHGK